PGQEAGPPEAVTTLADCCAAASKYCNAISFWCNATMRLCNATSRTLARAALAGALLSSCAGSTRLLVGEADRPAVAIAVSATLGASEAKVTVAFDNRADDPLGVDLDAVLLR